MRDKDKKNNNNRHDHAKERLGVAAEVIKITVIQRICQLSSVGLNACPPIMNLSILQMDNVKRNNAHGTNSLVQGQLVHSQSL